MVTFKFALVNTTLAQERLVVLGSSSSSIVICTAKSRIYFCRVVFTKVQSPVDSYRTSVPSHPMIPKGVFHVTTVLLLSPFGSMNTHLSDFNVLEL